MFVLKSKYLFYIFLISLFFGFRFLCAHEASREWAAIQNEVRNGVVQILSQEVEFNWKEPYKASEQQESLGSGFFINENGDIVTNAHVIEHAKKVWIRMPAFGKEKIGVYVKGTCPERDLALLCLSSSGKKLIHTKFEKIPFLSLGDSDKVQRTDKVLELGFPLGQYYLKGATGIVSGPEFIDGRALIQITAPINAGNSGGPLFNIDGEVIGINTSKIESAENVGYIIPINEFKLIADELKNNKLVRKPIIGLTFNESSNDQARFLSNPVPGGLYIYKVYPWTIAEKIGLLPGDMMYELNGYKLDAHGETDVEWRTDKASITELVNRLKIGTNVNIKFYRNGKCHETSFIFSEPPIYPIREKYPDLETIDYEVFGGMIFMELADNHLSLLVDENKHLVRYTKPENKTKSAIIVTHTIPGSQARRIEAIRVGDIIVEINGLPVYTLDDYRKVLEKSVKTGVVTVKTSEGVFVVFSLKKMLRDEKKLSHDVKYPISKTVKRLFLNNGNDLNNNENNLRIRP